MDSANRGGKSFDTDAFELKRMMRQDAHEKAFEIQVQGQRIFERSRDSDANAQKRLLNKEFEDKTTSLKINTKIAYSAKTNKVRLHKMTYRNGKLEKLREQAMAMLIKTMNEDQDKYRQTLKECIVQGMIKMLEEDVELLIREGDEDLVEGLLSECQESYEEILLQETGREYKTNLTIYSERRLTKEQGGETGGIILMAHGRRITVQNTLMDRLALTFDQELPQIRRMLFPDENSKAQNRK